MSAAELNPADVRVEVLHTRPGGFAPVAPVGVRLIHTPTGITVEETAARSAHANRAVAWERLAKLVTAAEYHAMAAHRLAFQLLAAANYIDALGGVSCSYRQALAAVKAPAQCHKRRNGACGCSRKAALCDGFGPAAPEAPAHTCSRWTERWHGFGPDRGWSIWEMTTSTHGDRVAYVGEGEHSERLTAVIVQKHNESLAAAPEAPAKHDRHALQAEGRHPAPCARFCEATAHADDAERLLRQALEVTESLASHYPGTSVPALVEPLQAAIRQHLHP